MTDHKQSTYVRIWVTRVGAFKFHNHKNKQDAEKAFNAGLVHAPIWAALIDFNHETLAARTLKYHREAE